MAPRDRVSLLNETNYEDWEPKMSALLEEADLLEVVLGTEPEPTTGANSKAARAYAGPPKFCMEVGGPAYAKKQRLAKAKIVLNVENSQLPHTRFDTAREIWDELARIHRSRGFGSLLAARRNLFGMRNASDQPMES
ncbi:hypothetical protein GGX14DRAFT_577383 [Mycena pura]|uniref:DUF4219 domain-containing protein n=1 Tax=Mycena pura TaxID=153505 RepID=A0AAD6UUZ0_9AGAR|nr:hypothetical protein GGX14DRAFT_577383 [Mycena pura]